MAVIISTAELKLISGKLLTREAALPRRSHLQQIPSQQKIAALKDRRFYHLLRRRFLPG